MTSNILTPDQIGQRPNVDYREVELKDLGEAIYEGKVESRNIAVIFKPAAWAAVCKDAGGRHVAEARFKKSGVGVWIADKDSAAWTCIDMEIVKRMRDPLVLRVVDDKLGD